MMSVYGELTIYRKFAWNANHRTWDTWLRYTCQTEMSSICSKQLCVRLHVESQKTWPEDRPLAPFGLKGFTGDLIRLICPVTWCSALSEQAMRDGVMWGR